MKNLHWYDIFSINIYWLGLTSVSQTINPLIIPLLIQQFVGENQQGTYFGIIRFWTLMMAIIFQSLFGMLSDQFTSRIGKRKPFILAGTLGLDILILSLGFLQTMAGLAGFWLLFLIVMLVMIFANMAHGALQGLIPDLVPKQRYGRFAGAKALFEVPLPAILISFTIADLIGNGNLWGGLIVLVLVLDACAALTMFAPEEKSSTGKLHVDWQAIKPLVYMTAAFGGIILLAGNTLPLLTPWLRTLPVVHQIPAMIAFGIFIIGVAVIAGIQLSLRIGLGKNGRKEKRNYRLWLLNRLTFLLGVTNMVSFLVYFIQAKLQISGEAAVQPAAIMMRYVGIFILVSALPGGWLADHMPKKWLIFFGTIAAFIGAVILILAGDLNQIYLGGVLLGSAAGIFYSANWALGTELVPMDESGKYLGMSNLASAGAGAIGAYVGGPIADYFTNVPGVDGFGYIVLFIIFSCLILISLSTLPFIRENTSKGFSV